jgi:hypothetical protein
MFPEIGTRPVAANPAAGRLVTVIVVPGAGPARCDRFDTPNRPPPAAEGTHTATANPRSLVLP